MRTVSVAGRVACVMGGGIGTGSNRGKLSLARMVLFSASAHYGKRKLLSKQKASRAIRGACRRRRQRCSRPAVEAIQPRHRARAQARLQVLRQLLAQFHTPLVKLLMPHRLPLQNTRCSCSAR